MGCLWATKIKPWKDLFIFVAHSHPVPKSQFQMAKFKRPHITIFVYLCPLIAALLPPQLSSRGHQFPNTVNLCLSLAVKQNFKNDDPFEDMLDNHYQGTWLCPLAIIHSVMFRTSHSLLLQRKRGVKGTTRGLSATSSFSCWSSSEKY